MSVPGVRVESGGLAEELARELAHWRLAATRLGELEAVAPIAAWQRLEHYLGVSLQLTIRTAVSRLERQGEHLDRGLREGRAGADLARLGAALLDFRRGYSRVETMVDFYADALATRAAPRIGALLRACDHIATRGMAEILAPLGRQVPAVLSYLDSGIGASILKAGIRLWDGTSDNPTAAIKVVRHNLLRCTSVLHEAGHQVAHMLGWNGELAAALRQRLATHSRELAELYAAWASEIAADAFAFAHTGYASVAALHDVIDGPDAVVFQILPGDPHPPSDVRLSLGIELCRQAYGSGPWDGLAEAWRLRHPVANAPADVRGLVQASPRVVPEVTGLLLQGRFRAFGMAPLTTLINPARVSPRELLRLEREAGAAAYGSPYWMWNESIRLLALTGYYAAQGAAALRAATEQQERWMLRLGALRQAA
jgi:hypothetical protein